MEVTFQSFLSVVASLVFVILTGVKGCPTAATYCKCEGLIINCRDKTLTAIPPFTPDITVYDEITFGSSGFTSSRRNNITSISANAFINIQVKKIDLTANSIGSVNPNAFAGLESVLLELKIQGDGTAAPPYNALTGLFNLEKLYLESFRQEELAANNSFGSFPDLISLEIKGFSNLRVVNSGIFENKTQKLKTLKFESVPIWSSVNLAGAIAKLPQLETLDIVQTDIPTFFIDSFSALNNLRNLDISHNTKLTTFRSGCFNGIGDTLQFLNLQVNKKLSETSLAVLKEPTWSVLDQLNMAEMQLSQLPSGMFSKMSALSYLNLEGNHFTRLDSSNFTGLNSLNTLQLQYNQISTVGARTFTPMPLLSYLQLHSQGDWSPDYSRFIPIDVDVASSAFQGVDNIEFLFLNDAIWNSNQLWSIIAGQRSLVHLSLTNTGLSSIPDFAFENNYKLKHLDLNDNSLSTLSQRAFHGPKFTLKRINLNNNNLQTLDQCVFYGYELLKFPSTDPSDPQTLLLSGNRWQCDCGLDWLHTLIASLPSTNQFLQYLQLFCYSPKNLQGEELSTVSKHDLCLSSPVTKTCPDLYSTTTTSSPRTTPVGLLPTMRISIEDETINSITVSWKVHGDTTDLTGFQLSTTPASETLNFDRVTTGYNIPSLTPATFYQICIYGKISDTVNPKVKACDSGLTKRPLPEASFSFKERTTITITVQWTIDDKTDLTGYRLEWTDLATNERNTRPIHRDDIQYTLQQLTMDNNYQLCLTVELNRIDFNSIPANPECISVSTRAEVTTTAVPNTTEKQTSNVGIIAGSVVGGVVLIVIVLVILYLLLIRKKSSKQPPTAIPAGGFTTAAAAPRTTEDRHRFSKPKSNEGTSPDDIQVKVISNGMQDDSRMSAGSYQFLNEPRDRTSKEKIRGSGGYVNTPEDRPLPKKPYNYDAIKARLKDSGGGGYVNTGYKPEAEPNVYHEIRDPKY